ncbi:MAG: flavin reductase [Desulfobacterales bacterium]|nr:MAG: flavin reductase [Desulfobacterales bacterium]
MRVLALNGSPRKKGNTDYLLTALLAEFDGRGAVTQKFDLARMHVMPCKEYMVCEKKGVCPIHDDVETLLYPALRNADIVLLGSPVFFYNITAQAKALVDRTQLFWARVYRLGLTDPKKHFRRGLAVSVGATRGRKLFSGVELTARYFHDAISAIHEKGLYYQGIENRGDMAAHPGHAADIQATVGRLMAPLAHRPGVLFLDRGHAGAARIAAAFLEYTAGDQIEVLSAGIAPAETSHPMVETIMAEEKIDMLFRMTRSLDGALAEIRPAAAVLMGDISPPPELDDISIIRWNDLPSVSEDPDSWRGLRDDLKRRVADLLPRIKGSDPISGE